jgi:BirA family transcriptional regulator, biotin operon repressor / biotin---[acetyl-CoA-carboxylase] ligase
MSLMSFLKLLEKIKVSAFANLLQTYWGSLTNLFNEITKLYKMKLRRHQLETELLKLSHKETLQQLYLYDSIPSTNQIAWELLDRSITLPIVAIASQQTAGRGQWGRQWQSTNGGLYLSVAININIPASDAPHLTLFSAWGIADALRCHDIPVWLKWPNDLILEGRKLGGIKTETRIQQERISQAVIGVGINWKNSVPEMGINLQSHTDKITSLEKLAAIAISGIFTGYQCYLSNGIEILLSSYLTLLKSVGQKVEVNGCAGVVVGVNAKGELQVRLNSPGATTEINLPSGTIALGYDTATSEQ